MGINSRKPLDRDSLVYLTESAKLDFALELNACLAKLKITQQELAERIGVKAPYLTRVLRGDENLTIATMTKLASASGKRLNIHLSDTDCHVRWIEVFHGLRPEATAQRTLDWRRFGDLHQSIDNNGAANDYEIEPIAA